MNNTKLLCLKFSSAFFFFFVTWVKLESDTWNGIHRTQGGLDSEYAMR